MHLSQQQQANRRAIESEKQGVQEEPEGMTECKLVSVITHKIQKLDSGFLGQLRAFAGCETEKCRDE